MKNFKFFSKLSLNLLLSAFVLGLGSLTFAGVTAKNLDDRQQFKKTADTQNLVSKQLESEIKSTKIKVAEPTFEKKIENYRKYLLEPKDYDPYCKMGGTINIVENFDVEKYREKAEDLYKKIKEIVRTSDEKGFKAEDFDCYIENVMKENGGANMPVVGRNQFEKIVESNSNKMLRLYRGIKKREWFDKFRNGEVSFGSRSGLKSYFYVDSGFSGNGNGYGIYTSTKEKNARNYVLNFGEESEETNEETRMQWPKCDLVEDGGVVEMLIDESKSEFININDLREIIFTMLYLHPTDFGEVESFDKRIPSNIYNTFQYQNIFRPAFKETFGFDCNDLALRLNSNYRELKYNDAEFNDFKNNMDKIFQTNRGLTEEFDKKIDKLMRDNKIKSHYVNKFYAVLKELGLMAQLLGYDAIVENGVDEVCVVNSRGLVVCNEGLPDEEASVTFDDLVKKEDIGI